MGKMRGSATLCAEVGGELKVVEWILHATHYINGHDEKSSEV